MTARRAIQAVPHLGIHRAEADLPGIIHPTPLVVIRKPE